MGIVKEWFIRAHEELIEEYLLEHPEATEAEAYEKTADKANDRMAYNMADLADRVKDEYKEK